MNKGKKKVRGYYRYSFIIINGHKVEVRKWVKPYFRKSKGGSKNEI